MFSLLNPREIPKGAVKKQAQSLNWDHWLRDPVQHKGHWNLFQRNRPGRYSNLTSIGAIVYANRGNAWKCSMFFTCIWICVTLMYCANDTDTSPKLLNLIELIRDDHAVLIISSSSFVRIMCLYLFLPTALWSHLKMPARTLSLVPPSAKSLPQWQCILDYFGISFICLIVNPSLILARIFQCPNWIFCYRLFTLKFHHAMRYQYAFTFVSKMFWSLFETTCLWNDWNPNVTDLQNATNRWHPMACEVGTFMDPKMHQRYFAEISINKDNHKRVIWNTRFWDDSWSQWHNGCNCSMMHYFKWSL